MVKNQVIEKLLEIVRKEINLLKEMQNISLESYLHDEKSQHIVERAFQQSIQSCIDIGARIISQSNFQVPDNYHEIFDILAKEKIISGSLCKKMKEMVGFRNALVHEYRWIRNEEVYRHLQKSLDTVKAFAECIVKYL